MKAYTASLVGLTVVGVLVGVPYVICTNIENESFLNSLKNAKSVEELMDLINQKGYYIHQQTYTESKHEKIDLDTLDESKYDYLVQDNNNLYGVKEVKYIRQLLSTKENIEGFENIRKYEPTKDFNIDDEIFAYLLPSGDIELVNYPTHIIYPDLYDDVEFLGITDEKLLENYNRTIDYKRDSIIDTSSNKVAVKQ